MGISILATSLVFSGLLYAGLLLASKSISKKASSTGSSEEVKLAEISISKLDTNITNAIEYAKDLVPLSNLLDLVKTKDGFEDNLANERTKLELLEGKLNQIQEKVTSEEENHSNLKKGRAEAIDLANSIREKKGQLEKEQKKLVEDLGDSKNKLENLSTEVSLSPDQEIGLNLIKATIKSTHEQFTALSQTYKQSSTRFASLHSQYADLEGEFTKLVEKDLSGEALEKDD